MYVVYNRLPVPAEHAQAFENMFNASFEHLKGVPGLLRTTLQRPTKPEQPYISTMEWASQADFMTWMQSDSFRASHVMPEGTPKEAMGKGSVIETYDTITDLKF